MVKKTKYHYRCTTNEGIEETFIVSMEDKRFMLNNKEDINLNDIAEAEEFMCNKFREVILVGKEEITVQATLLDLPLSSSSLGLMKLDGITGAEWCLCNGVYNDSNDLFCPRCKKPIA